MNCRQLINLVALTSLVMSIAGLAAAQEGDVLIIHAGTLLAIPGEAPVSQ